MAKTIIMTAESKKDKYSWITSSLKIIMVVSFTLFGIAVLLRFITPFGVAIKYDFNISENAELFGRIRDVDRSAEVSLTEGQVKILDRFDLTKEMTEFSVIPISFDLDKIKFTLSFVPNNKSTMLLLKNFRTQSLESILLHSDTINQLGGFDFSFRGYRVWSFNPDIKSVFDLDQQVSTYSEISKSIDTCIMDTSFYVDNEPEDSFTYNTPKRIPHVLRGPHTFLIYVNNDGVLDFNFDKNDLNWYSGTDDLEVEIKHHENIIYQYTIPDDGIFDGLFGRPVINLQSHNISLRDLDAGVYELNIKATEDVLISNISYRNSKIIIKSDVFLANNSVYNIKQETMDVFTYSPRVFISTFHDANKQEVIVNDESYLLSNLASFDSLELLTENLNHLQFTENNLRLSSSEYFALEREAYFKPTNFNEVNCLNLDISLVKSKDLLVVKNLAQKTADDTFSFTTSFKEDYIGPEGKIYFYIYNPGLGVDQYKIELKKLQIDFIKNGIFD